MTSIEQAVKRAALNGYRNLVEPGDVQNELNIWLHNPAATRGEMPTNEQCQFRAMARKMIDNPYSDFLPAGVLENIGRSGEYEVED